MITNEEFKKLQDLTKINFTNKALKKVFITKLTHVMKMIDKLHEVNDISLKPLHSVCPMYQRTRTDEVKINNSCDDILKNAPATELDSIKTIKCFVVPKIIE
jgi:aspartyl/glutamyl-tRNA(Asn/Gln) amidotransferase C subunit